MSAISWWRWPLPCRNPNIWTSACLQLIDAHSYVADHSSLNKNQVLKNIQLQTSRTNPQGLQHFWTLPNHPEREKGTSGNISSCNFLQFGPVLQHPSRPKREAIFRSCLVITSLSSATNRTGLVSFHVIPSMESKDMNMAQAGPRHMPFSNHQRYP